MKKKTYSRKIVAGLSLAALLSVGTLAYGSGGGDGHGGGASATAMSPTETIKTFVQGNDQFKGHHDSHYFDAYQAGQAPNLTVISCADSRVHTTLFGMDPNNKIFSIRNVGNQVSNSEGSVDYGIMHLPTRVLLIMGHSSCGAVKAAMGDYSGETAGIKAELDPLKPVIAKDSGEGLFEVRWAKNIEVNVDYQVNHATGLYRSQIEAGKLIVVGGVYDFTDNYGKGRGTLVITNVNGENDPNKIMQLPALNELSKAEIINHVGSLAPAVVW